MKKSLCGVILVSVLCFLIVGCGNNNTNSSQSVQKDSQVEVTESSVEETEEKETAEITIGEPVVIGDFIFYTEAWHRVTGRDSADGEGYQATLYFDRSSEPFDINNYDWKNDPIKFDLKPAEDLRLIMNSISGADKDSGHQGQFVFLYSIPVGQDLPETATLINERTGESAEIDMSGMVVLE